MKLKRASFLALFVCLGSAMTLYAQTENYPQDRLYGQVRSLKEIGGLYSTKAGGWNQRTFVPTELRNYDPSGTLMACTTYTYKALRTDALLRKTVYTYDSVAMQRERVTYNGTNILQTHEVTALDSGGEASEMQLRDRSGELSMTVDYKYDLDGNLVEEARYNTRQVLLGRTGYGYDYRGRLTETIEYNSVGEVVRRVVRTFNSHGLVAEETEYNFTMRGVDSLTQTVYTYDSLGRLDRAQWYNASAMRYTGGDFKPRQVRETDYTYDAKGNLSRMLTSDEVAGYEERVDFDCDEQGNWVRKEHYRRPLKSGDAEFSPYESYVRTITYYAS